MARLDDKARRLHPKLRMLANGSDLVNALRSEISSTVVSTRRPSPEPTAPDAPLVAINLSAAQACMQWLPPTLIEEPRKRRLARRRKLPSAGAAKKAFVNVFVEFVRERPGTTEETLAKSMESVVKQIRRSLRSKGDASANGIVKRRRNFVAATIPVALLPALKKNDSVAFVHPAEPLRVDLPEHNATTSAPNLSVGNRSKTGSGKGVLIGIIDVGGFDFSHSEFLDENGKTRFLAIWDQGGSTRSPPVEFGYGAEIRGQDINAALLASRKPGGLPATQLEPQSQQSESSHATHVASIAAGKHGVCPQALIAAVLVSVPVPVDEREQRRFTFSDSSRITHAVEYLLALGKKEGVPVSINISLGTNGGAHDGCSGVSRWLDALLGSPGRAICVAAGNAGQEAAEREGDIGWIMGRIHTAGRIAARDLDVDLEWTVIGNGITDVSENELEIWYGAQDRVIAMVQPPGSDEWITVRPREFVENRRLSSGTTVSVYNELYHPTNGQNYIAIYLSPNLEQNAFVGVQAGVWRVRLRGEEIRDGSFHGWVERDDPSELSTQSSKRLFAFPSFFSAKSNIDSHSINSLACGHRVIAVANSDDARQKVNITSSQGPTRDGRCKPDVCAPGTDVVAANGFSRDGQRWVSMTGTSMASPYVCGVIGLMLAAKPELTAVQCLGILQRTSQPLPGKSFEWQNDAGFGRIQPEPAIEEAKRLNERIELRTRSGGTA